MTTWLHYADGSANVYRVAAFIVKRGPELLAFDAFIAKLGG